MRTHTSWGSRPFNIFTNCVCEALASVATQEVAYLLARRGNSPKAYNFRPNSVWWYSEFSAPTRNPNVKEIRRIDVRDRDVVGQVSNEQWRTWRQAQVLWKRGEDAEVKPKFICPVAYDGAGNPLPFTKPAWTASVPGHTSTESPDHGPTHTP
jgi:hypothetical protein